MPSLADVKPESQRIDFLVRRDGYAQARKWVERTAGLYRAALAQHGHYAGDPRYRPLFEKAVREFEEWLDQSREESRSDRDTRPPVPAGPPSR